MPKTVEELSASLGETTDKVTCLEHEIKNLKSRIDQYKKNPALAASIEILQATLNEFNKHSSYQYEIDGRDLWVLNRFPGDLKMGSLEKMVGFTVDGLKITIFNSRPELDWVLEPSGWAKGVYIIRFEKSI